MLQIIGLIVVLLAVGAGVYYFGFYKRGKINDRDGDYIPDEIEDAADKVKGAAKEVKRRAKNVKKELKDVVEAAKEVSNQVIYLFTAWVASPKSTFNFNSLAFFLRASRALLRSSFSFLRSSKLPSAIVSLNP